MKKVVFGILAAVTISACHSGQKPTLIAGVVPQNMMRYSLNGISYEDANTMVKRFNLDTKSSDQITAIRLSKKWVEEVTDMLDSEKGADGFRIYFAKQIEGKDSGRNTIVIVSTMADGPDTSTETKNIHLDYFAHSSAFLSTNDAKIAVEYEQDPGATLFNNKADCTGDCLLSKLNNITCDNAHKAVLNLLSYQSSPINISSEWFPLGLLEYLKKELDSPGAVAAHANGIRIYFARHTKETNFPHKGKNALIITTTLDPMDESTHYKDYFNCYYQGDLDWTSHNFYTNDNGEQCPNNCTGSTLPQP